MICDSTPDRMAEHLEQVKHVLKLLQSGHPVPLTVMGILKLDRSSPAHQNAAA